MTGGASARLPWIVGVSGASGTPYARAVINGLLDAGLDVDLVISRAARLTILDETGIEWNDRRWQESLERWRGTAEHLDRVRHWSPGDLGAGPSSGSYPTRGMIVVPASTASCAGIALGLSKDLLQRAADVTLKERRRLVIVPREMPLARSTLVHLLALHDAGAVVAPASPAFYSVDAGADQIGALVDFVAGKILDIVEVEHDLFTRWVGGVGRRHQTGEAEQS